MAKIVNLNIESPTKKETEKPEEIDKEELIKTLARTLRARGANLATINERIEKLKEKLGEEN